MAKSLFCICFCILAVVPALAYKPHTIRHPHVTLLYEEGLGSVAENLAAIHDEILVEVENSIGWRLDGVPTLIVLRRAMFLKTGASPHVVAVADARRQTIVFDATTINLQENPSWPVILKHELWHLLLGQHIRRKSLPRWLNEGVAIVFSEGYSELLTPGRPDILRGALLSNRLIPLNRLTEKFPAGEREMGLAYAQSASIVAYCVHRFGGDGLIRLLDRLKHGETLPRAFQRTFGLSLDELEAQWLNSLHQTPSAWMFLVRYLYEILFFLCAVIGAWAGFRRIRQRRRDLAEYEDAEDEGDGGPPSFR